MKNEWRTKRLGDIAEVRAGNPAPQDEALFSDGTYPFFRTADAGRVRFGDIFESADYLNQRGVGGLRRYPKGTILFPKSGASTFLNHRVILGVEGCVSSHLATIVADCTQVEPRFLLYFLSTIAAQDLVQDHAYGHEEKEARHQAGRRQGAQPPAHRRHDLLEPRRHADVGQAVPGKPLWRPARPVQERGRATRAMERPGHAPEAARWPGRARLQQGRAGRDAEGDRRREQRPVRRAAYVAYARATVSREARATTARGEIKTAFNDKQRGFLDFVLSQYVKEGVGELDPEKLPPLISLKYGALADGIADLGTAEQIRQAFVGFQKYLYQDIKKDQAG